MVGPAVGVALQRPKLAGFGTRDFVGLASSALEPYPRGDAAQSPMDRNSQFRAALTDASRTLAGHELFAKPEWNIEVDPMAGTTGLVS
jgi:hypothetical protein